jgi:KDO2-lipid IV(A) lauroyltransferase
MNSSDCRPTFRQRLGAGLARGIFAGIGFLPRRDVLALAAVLGCLMYLARRRWRTVGRANLDLVFGGSRTSAEKRRILRRACRNLALTGLDVIWFSARPVERLRRWIDFEELDLDDLRRQACLCVTAHLGNWELLGQSVSLIGLPLASVAMTLRNPSLDAWLNGARGQTGQRVIPRAGALKKILAALARGEAVALLLDQNTGLDEGGEFHDFFGVPATVSPIAGLLACRTGASVRFGFCLPTQGGRYRVPRIIGFDVPAVSGPAFEPAKREVTDRILRAYEERIRQSPECWLWMYKRWKHIRPGDDPARYPSYSSRLDAP